MMHRRVVICLLSTRRANVYCVRTYRTRRGGRNRDRLGLFQRYSLVMWLRRLRRFFLHRVIRVAFCPFSVGLLGKVFVGRTLPVDYNGVCLSDERVSLYNCLDVPGLFLRMGRVVN